MSIRVRFAPSPTGYLHIGGARTALFNWLYARHHKGTFLLRIEDTDAARNTQAAVDVILNGLRWLGLDWDEGPLTGDPSGSSQGGHGPYFQSQRSQVYSKWVEKLLSKDLAYRQDGAVKFRMTRDPIVVRDVVVGDVIRQLTDREESDPDFVIVRSDGQPVFHLVNVIDDIEMQITHVIRGEDHLSNTSKHIALCGAFGVEPPRYAHIPLILNPDGSKMSKRDTGASLSTYQDGGYVPEAVVNYLCLLGWSPKGNRERMSIAEVVSLFDLPQIIRHNARFDFTKLNWLNWEYIRALDDDRFVTETTRALRNAGIDTAPYDPAYTRAALLTCKEKIKIFPEIVEFAGFYFADQVALDSESARKELTAENKPGMERLRKAFSQLGTFTADTLQGALKATAAELGVKVGVLVHPIRVATTGSPVGPSLYHSLEILGKERVLQRLDRALAQI